MVNSSARVNKHGGAGVEEEPTYRQKHTIRNGEFDFQKNSYLFAICNTIIKNRLVS